MNDKNCPCYPWHVPGFAPWHQALRAHMFCERALTQVMAGLGFKLPHYEVLANIAARPGISQAELTEYLVAAKSGISMIIHELDRQGLVTRVTDSADKRLRRLFVTAEGESRLKPALAAHTEFLENILMAVSPEDMHTITTVAERVINRLEGTLSKEPRP